MTTERTVTSSTTGTYAAKVQSQRDFDADKVGVFFDGEFYHCSGREGGNDPASDFRVIYILVKRNQTDLSLTFHKLLYVTGSGPIRDKAIANEGTFTVNFDESVQHYKMSFHVVAKGPGIPDVDILGSFDLRQE
ncbi:hypothetical protein ABH912_002908 [Pseudomonas sp. BT76 TE3572]|uniref:Uncharacterized protein n=1 Tax=Pseudomonas mandelii PD30 TaxID=1419583 RepID=A0A059L2Y8_9PSED|nr:hypothetical protein [Pseudomonas mandelii]KDD68389.1 hypothetical protein V466_14285 [Pseudomonas mandelii PD30]